LSAAFGLSVARLPLSEIVRCPRCGGRLADAGEAMPCRGCGHVYPVASGLPLLFVPNEPTVALDFTDTVKAFYEETPFPSYDDLDTRESLRAKARQGVFARLLDEQIPPEALVLEAGCGTGQLTNFLGMSWRRRVIGADLCLNSLRLARDFKDRFGIVNADFVQMNLFRPPFADESLDLVIVSGVLHHTADAAGGFCTLLKKLKPGGHVVVGLYNRLGRLPTLWRRRLIELFGDRLARLDPRLRGETTNAARGAAWFRDQYRHPHETRHSMSEVLGWFARDGVQFVSSLPLIGDAEMAEDERLFEPRSAGGGLDRFATELEMLLSGGTDGGLFIMLGRKR
jgi:SAM-dependent methyltransferase